MNGGLINKVNDMNIKLITHALVRASDYNPIISTLTVILFYIMFNLIEGTIETLIWGDRFVHWLDPIFQIGFMAYAAYAVWVCAECQIEEELKKIS